MLLRRPPHPVLIAVTAIGLFLFILFQVDRFRQQPVTSSLDTESDPVLEGLAKDIYNTTLGFEKIFVVGLASRTDRRDGMVLAAALSNLEIEFIDGVVGQDVPDRAIPLGPKGVRLPDANVGSWRAHMNAVQEVVRRNLTSALIIEDDADWDVRLRDQLRDFATAAQALTQPLAGTTDRYADPTYPSPALAAGAGAGAGAGADAAGPLPNMSFFDLPATRPATTSPYGDEWDVLWPGHCGMRFPAASRQRAVIPRGRVVRDHDETVPEARHLTSVVRPHDLAVQYPNHTRVVAHVREAACSLGYAVTRRAARQLLLEVGLGLLDQPFDLQLRRFCEGSGGRSYHNCLTAHPSLLHHHRPAGPRSAESDISDHGDGYVEEARTPVVRWSVRMNAQVLITGGTQFVDQWPDAEVDSGL